MSMPAFPILALLIVRTKLLKKWRFYTRSRIVLPGRADTSCQQTNDPHNASQPNRRGETNVFKSRWWSKNGCYLPIFGSITTFDLHSVNVPESVLHLWNHVSAVILVFFPRFLHRWFLGPTPPGPTLLIGFCSLHLIRGQVLPWSCSFGVGFSTTVMKSGILFKQPLSKSVDTSW